MSKQEDTTEDMAIEYEVMPGADRPEEDHAHQLDLSFAEVEELTQESVEEEEELTQESVEEGDEEVVAEVEEVEEGQDDAEEEALVAELEDAAEAKPSKKQMVPKARLDEVLAKQKALQKQLDEMTAANVKTAEAPSA